MTDAGKDRERDCIACRGICCRHVALPIDKPACKREIDNIRWYLMHENVQVFIDHENDWLIQFLTPCSHLNAGFRCDMYAERPKLCRDYPSDDKPCEYESDEPVYKVLFTTPKQFEQYLEKKGIDWRYKKLPK